MKVRKLCDRDLRMAKSSLTRSRQAQPWMLDGGIWCKKAEIREPRSSFAVDVVCNEMKRDAALLAAFAFPLLLVPLVAARPPCSVLGWALRRFQSLLSSFIAQGAAMRLRCPPQSLLRPGTGACWGFMCSLFCVSNMSEMCLSLGWSMMVS